MDFPTSLGQLIDAGAKITRTSWKDEDRFVFLHKSGPDVDIRLWRSAAKGAISYIPTLDDMLAKDWELVRPAADEQAVAG